MMDGTRARDDFLSEAQEIIEGLGRDVLALDDAERAGRVDPELVNDVFRAVHTLKGLAGLFGAARMSTLSHELESALDDLRLGRIELTPELLDRLFRAVEMYGLLLLAEKDGTDVPMPELDDLVRELGQRTGTVGSLSPSAEYDLDAGLLGVLTEYEEHRLRSNIAQGLALYRLSVEFELASIDRGLDELMAAAKPHGEIITYLPTGTGTDADAIAIDILLASRSTAAALVEALGPYGVNVEEVPRVRRPDRTSARAGAVHSRIPVTSLGETPAVPLPSLSLAPRPEGGSRSIPAKALEGPSLRSVTQTVRVDIHKLDHLMNIVGELAIVRGTLARTIERVRASSGNRALGTQLARIQRTFERQLDAMQQGILEVRMVPLGQVFDKLARVVRQISREADKEVNLIITGAETEIDKLIVEELSDPLMHMMRNAIDHGIEPRSQREAVGKPRAGTVALNAFQKGNHVVVELEDDGRGIDGERLVRAAAKRGIAVSEELRGNRQELLALMFVPGLSTKEGVSDLSGRGVGMDVVKTNIAKLGGVIDVTSEVGIGTKVTLTLPVTLAIVRALIVEVGETSLAIPLSNVQEVIVLRRDAVHPIDGRPAITLRGGTLRLASLAAMWAEGDAAAATRPFGSFVVVAAVGARRLGLVVDRLQGQQDIVVKALGRSLAGVRGLAGAMELGDGRLGLVIDAPSLVEDVYGGAGAEPRALPPAEAAS